MQLLTKELIQELRQKLPKLGETESQGLEALALVSFLIPDGSWTWYASEFDGEDTFFGFVVGVYPELGYFRFSELQKVRGALGLPVERDLWFEPTTLKVLLEKHMKEV